MNAKRDKKIEIRVTQKEKEAIQERAELLHHSVSEFARLVMLNGEVKIMPFRDFDQIKKIGNNLNQMTKVLHFTKSYKESELREIIEELREEVREMSTFHLPIID